MTVKLYSLENSFVKETDTFPNNFTGIAEYSDGSKYWCVGGKLHRIDGPAFEYPDGSKYWYVDGKRHRIAM